MIENIKLMTRSTAVDYEYFGGDTQTDWLRTYQKYFYNDASALSLSLFGVISGKQWKVFLGRIPSPNRDSFTRQISYIIKAEGVCGNEDSTKIAKLLTTVIADSNGMQKVGKIFSKEFLLEYINSLDEKRHTPETASEINGKLDKIFDSLDVKLSDKIFDGDDLTFDYWTPDNANKLCSLVTKITDANIDFDEKYLFAETDLPISNKDAEELFSISKNANGLVLTTNKDMSDEMPVVKKKSLSNNTKTKKESPKESKNGWTKTQKMLIFLLIISLITNFALIFSRPSDDTEKISLLTAKQDSLNSLKSTLGDYTDSLTKVNQRFDSIISLQSYSDTINKNIVKLDLAEFAKHGVSKIITTDNGKPNDTIIVRSNIDFDKTKKGYINVYRNSESEPIEEYKFSVKK